VPLFRKPGGVPYGYNYRFFAKNKLKRNLNKNKTAAREVHRRIPEKHCESPDFKISLQIREK
jgi:hypothetical protein